MFIMPGACRNSRGSCAAGAGHGMGRARRTAGSITGSGMTQEKTLCICWGSSGFMPCEVAEPVANDDAATNTAGAKAAAAKRRKVDVLTPCRAFCAKARQEGYTISQAAAAWRASEVRKALVEQMTEGQRKKGKFDV